jgi:hypothetical protein
MPNQSPAGLDHALLQVGQGPVAYSLGQRQPPPRGFKRPNLQLSWAVREKNWPLAGMQEAAGSVQKTSTITLPPSAPRTRDHL